MTEPSTIAAPQPTEWERVRAFVARQVALLNATLGLADAEHSRKVTFGYIGNLGHGRDDRLWYVFLPHPGRVGTPADTLGGFSTGGVASLGALAGQVAAFRRGVEFASSRAAS